ncbi:MAG: HmuY family protein [Bacteroidetes bacterium]|nr:HmuY family protein [Bacteroidota bacterium]
MKKLLLSMSVALITLTSCSKNDDPTPTPVVSETKEASIDATSKTAWTYFSLSENKVVATAEESDAENAKWFARADWDIAVCRYKIRTNSGEATTVGSKGGVYTFDKDTKFEAVTKLSSDIKFTADEKTSHVAMGGKKVTEIKSNVLVVEMKKTWDETEKEWKTIMPPVYLQTPVYIFRTADGKNTYKVQFTQYQDENKESGHVKFYSAHII